jgi:hypothetical protein
MEGTITFFFLLWKCVNQNSLGNADILDSRAYT